MKSDFVVSLAACFLFVVPAVMAEEGQASIAPCECAPPTLPIVALGDLLESVSRNSNREFLVDSRVPADVVIGQFDWHDVTDRLLHTVLRNNELAAVTVQGVVNVVPVATIRQYPLPVLYEDDENMADDEWVMRIMRPKKLGAPMMVAILRSLLPQQGYLSAHPQSNTLMAVARYANARRIAEMVQDMDDHTSESTE